MIAAIHNLIDSLREELKEYGEMLTRLDQQQESIFQRKADELLVATDSVNAQAEMIAVARHEREQRQRDLARTLQLPDEVAFAVLTPRLPSDLHPLVGALVQENNELLTRIQQRARQNHLLLSRSVELTQKIVASVLPGSEPTTYGGSGRVQTIPAPRHSIYDAIG